MPSATLSFPTAFFLRSYDVLTGTPAHPAHCAATFGLTDEDRQITDLVEDLRPGDYAGLLARADARLRFDPGKHIGFGVTHEAPDFSIAWAGAAESPAFQRGDAHAEKRGGLASSDKLDRGGGHWGLWRQHRLRAVWLRPSRNPITVRDIGIAPTDLIKSIVAT